jgi:hypothetical protein
MARDTALAAAALSLRTLVMVSALLIDAIARRELICSFLLYRLGTACPGCGGA